MSKIVIILFVALIGVVISKDIQMRVIGGKPARQGQFLYQVSLQVNGRHHCGGTLIAVNAIITAAHCVHNMLPSSIKVLAGTIHLNSGGVLANVEHIIYHPSYNPVTKDYDIGILMLQEHLPVDTDPLLHAIDIVDETELLTANDVGLLSGWGQFDGSGATSEILRYANLPLWARPYCNFPYITDRMYCAGSFDGQVSACPGDSGGPLVIRGKLAGVVSWGPGCGAVGPTVFTHLAFLRRWIRQTIQV